MKRIAKTFSVLFCAGALCAFTSCTIHQDAYSKRTVSVSGTGSVTIEADTATIILSVVTRGKDVAETSEENAKKMTAVQDAVIKTGISKECISTQNYSVYQESHYDNKTGRQIPDDYRVTNQIKILVKKISTASDVIDVALKNGANQLSSLTYGVTDTEIAKKQARSLAIQQAQEAANLLAGASGALVSGDVLGVVYLLINYRSSRDRGRKFINVFADGLKKFLTQSLEVMKSGASAALLSTLVAVKVWLIYQILGRLGGSEAMSCYALCMTLWSIGSMLSSACVDSAMPIVSTLYSEKDFASVRANGRLRAFGSSGLGSFTSRLSTSGDQLSANTSMAWSHMGSSCLSARSRQVIELNASVAFTSMSSSSSAFG